MANGNPSIRRQISVTVAAFDFGQRNTRIGRPRPLGEQRDRVDPAQHVDVHDGVTRPAGGGATPARDARPRMRNGARLVTST